MLLIDPPAASTPASSLQTVAVAEFMGKSIKKQMFLQDLAAFQPFSQAFSKPAGPVKVVQPSGRSMVAPHVFHQPAALRLNQLHGL